MKLRRLPALLLLPLLLVSCGDGGYSTAYPPPTGKEGYKEILPAEIAGVPVDITRIDLDPAAYHGAKALYGTSGSILILQTRDQAALDAYIDRGVKPVLEGFSNRASAKINGVWELRGSGAPGRFKAWQNSRWLFVMQAPNDALFDEMVSKFAYISKTK